MEHRVETHGRRADLLAKVRAAADTMQRAVGRDPRLRELRRSELDWLLTMGMLVKDPADRVAVLRLAIGWAFTYRRGRR